MSTAPATIGGYTLEAKLGAGGMGAVYRARHPRFPGREFALKVLLGEGAASADETERFAREMKALSAVTAHPNIVRIFGGAIDQGKPFYVMELVQGASLAGMVREGGLEPRRAASLARTIADAVAYVHDKGIIHRDLKPENILVEPGDKPRICDFGLAKLADSERLTHSGSMFGTPSYSAPEQLDGRANKADQRADVYALGAILWFTLVGRPPLVADSNFKLLNKVLVEPPDAPSVHAPGIPSELDAICLHALEKVPEDRYGTAALLRDDLDKFLRGEPVLAPPLTSLHGLARAANRREVKHGIRGALVVVLGVAVASVGTYFLRDYYERQRAVERRYVEAMNPGRPTKDLQDDLAFLRARDAPADRLGAVDRRLRERTLVDATQAARGDLGVATALALGNAAVAAPESASLVGEPVPGDATEGFAVGDALLRAFDAEIVRMTGAEDAKRIAAVTSQVIERRIRDPAGRMLRALARLAAMGGPREPLGGGLVGIRPDVEVESDLKAAADSLEGAPGRRAAWLLADLLLGTGDDARADEAIEAAAKAHPDPDLEAKLRLVRNATKDAAGYGQTRKQGPFVLSRFLARCGMPGALEHPELTDAAGVERVLAREDARRFALRVELAKAWDHRGRPWGQAWVEAHLLLNGARKGGAKQMSQDSIQDTGQTEEERIRAAVAPHRDEIDQLLAKAFRSGEFGSLVLSDAADPARGLLTSPVFAVLSSRTDLLGGDTLFESFCKDDRAMTRGFPVQDIFYADVWEPTGNKVGLAACEEWEGRLERDMKADPLVAVCRRVGLDAEIDAARDAARGFRRLEELVENPPASERERDELVFGALQGTERLAELGGPLVLPFRARLRLIAFDGALGNALARLDLRRALRLSGSFPGSVGEGEFPWWLDKFPVYLLGCAAVAEGLGDPRNGLKDDLMAAMVAWLHERAVGLSYDPRRQPKDDVRSAAERVRARVGALNDLLSDIGSDALRPTYDASREQFKSLKDAGRMVRTPEDERRVGSSGYAVQPHPIAKGSR